MKQKRKQSFGHNYIVYISIRKEMVQSGRKGFYGNEGQRDHFKPCDLPRSLVKLVYFI